LNEKVAIVIGGSSDIGHGIIDSLLKHNYRVVAAFTKRHINIENKNLVSQFLDMNDKLSIESFIKTISKNHSKIDVLLNCSGYIENTNFLHTESDEILKVFNINLFGHIEIMKFVFQKMCEQKQGKIISLSSIGVKFSGSANSVYYSASKSALEAVTKSFAKFGAEYNVLCNTIRVGVVDTKIHKGKDMDKRISMIPLKRIGKVTDIVGMVDFLISDEANFITGQDFAVSGGE
jgi:3-oxoacyl-[acyl-carrier protein] reductase